MHRDHRAAILCNTTSEASDALDAIANGRTEPPWTGTRGRRPRVVFVCSGQGPQWWGMGRELLATEPVFREFLERCDALLRDDVPWSLLTELAADERTSRLDRTEIAQPALVALQAALIALWRAWGVEPDAVIGHSVGEIAAAYAAGALSLSDALSVAAHRGRIMQRAAGSGRMVAVELSLDDARELAADYPDRLWVAAINGPTAVVLAGDGDAVTAVAAELAKRQVFARVLPGEYPFHTPRMEAYRHELVSALNGLRGTPSSVPVISTVSGRPSQPGDFDAAYWGRNIVEPVRFSSAISDVLAGGETIFVEIGPHPVLASAIAQSAALARVRSMSVASLRRHEPERATMLRSLGELYCAGVPVEWSRLYPVGRVVHLPIYAWQRERLWHAPRPYQPIEPAAATDGAAPQYRDGATEELLYETVWKSAGHAPGDAADSSTSAGPNGAWVVFGDGGALGNAILTHLGSIGASCTVVGDANIHDLDLSTIVRAACAGGSLVHVISLWALDAPMGVAGASETSSVLVRQCELLVRLSSALQGQRDRQHDRTLRAWIVTRGAQPVQDRETAVSVVGAGLWGWGRTMAAEDPATWGGLIDLDPDLEDVHQIARTLVSEVLRGDGEDQVAYRDNVRHIGRLRPLRSRPATRAWSSRSDASYLITGGLGVLGLAVAGWLVERGARRLVLLGRTPLPARNTWAGLDTTSEEGRRASAVRALEARGASVHIVTADAADPAQVAAAIDQFRAELWPPIRGVIHAAGVVRAQAIRGTTADNIDEVVRPKVAGACALDALFGEDLDFCVYFSSLSATLGSPLLAAYAAANAALDGIARDRRARGRRALSINWGRWRDAGMAQQESNQDSPGDGLSTADGLSALHWAMDRDISNVVIAEQRWDRWRAADPVTASRPFAAELFGEVGHGQWARSRIRNPRPAPRIRIPTRCARSRWLRGSNDGGVSCSKSFRASSRSRPRGSMRVSRSTRSASIR